jgi:asparagine synthase (glutamine-hydrolysing)
MCGLIGFFSLSQAPIPQASHTLWAMSRLISHRGPDGEGRYISPDQRLGLGHRRLAIIDLTPSGAQPMHGPDGKVMVFNGEIYNYPELRAEIGSRWQFKTQSDSEVLLAAYSLWGEACLTKLRGMFAFVIYDPNDQSLFAARDAFGIKPFYYAVIEGILYFGSEMKALMPILPEIKTDRIGFSEYITFQYSVTDQTLFSHIKQLLPAHALRADGNGLKIKRYWNVSHKVNPNPDPKWWAEALRERMEESITLHLRSDVPVGAYLSGGVDSGLTTILASQHDISARQSFHGRFTQYPGYDESHYAQIVAQKAHNQLHVIDITADDFRDNITKVIYHLDQPVAGPGSFPQYMVSKLASQHLKVVLGGQGGDEIFGGYARYFVGYLEALLKANIMGEADQFAPGFNEIAPNMGVLREYIPLIKQTWEKGLFGPQHERYLRIIDRSADLAGEVRLDMIDYDHVASAFGIIYQDETVIEGERPFERMTHFDFKCLLPALLQVEDRMSMAHGLESRVPFLDLPIVELIASTPTAVRFEGGRMKQMLRRSFDDVLPQAIFDRRDKMGFPVPLKEWWAHDLKDYVHDLFGSQIARERPYLNADNVLSSFAEAGQFSRKTWGLLSLELWHQEFHDKASGYKNMLDDEPPPFSTSHILSDQYAI